MIEPKAHEDLDELCEISTAVELTENGSREPLYSGLPDREQEPIE